MNPTSNALGIPLGVRMSRASIRVLLSRRLNWPALVLYCVNVATILYIDAVPGEFVQEAKFAGIRRYAAARGWEAVGVAEADSRPDNLRALMLKHRPVAGCVVEGSAGRRDLPPRLFGAVPVVYLDAPSPFPGQRAARVDADNAAIVRAAMRELASGHPPAYAFVGYYFATPWERAREKAFRAQAGATGRPWRVFRRVQADRNNHAARSARLCAWLATSSAPASRCPCGNTGREAGAEKIFRDSATRCAA